MAKLALRAGVPKSSCYRWIGGSARPKLEHMLCLARYFEVSLDYLADDTIVDQPRDEVSDDERMILELYRGLRAAGMTRAEVVAVLVAACRARSTGDVGGG